MKKRGKGIKEIPYDVVFNILSRLPVPSLLRFRSVCKSWNALISNNSQFIKSHLQRSGESNYRQEFMVFYSSPAIFCLIDYRQTCNYDHECCKEFDFPLKNGFNTSWVICSCDGLVLLQIVSHNAEGPEPNEHTFMLWNPAIRKYKSFSCHYDYDSNLDVGFGLYYDSLVGSYKVLIYVRQTIMVYDVKSESWSVVNQPSYSILRYQIGVLVDGKLHWTSIRDDDSIAIVYVDLLEAEFKEVPLPDHKWNQIGLGVLRGQLCVYNYDLLNYEIKTWVMEEYGKKESWTNFIVIPCPRNKIFYDVLNFTEKGDVLLAFGYQKSINKEVVMYNTKEGAFKTIISKCGYVTGWTMTTYAQSLVLV